MWRGEGREKRAAFKLLSIEFRFDSLIFMNQTDITFVTSYDT